MAETDPANKLSPFDVTLDAKTSEADATENRHPQAARIAMIGSSTPKLSRETHSLLRARLRAAAVIFLFGGTLFLIWRFLPSPTGRPPCPGSVDLMVLQANLALLGVMGFWAFILCPRCSMSLWNLRLAELTIFGVPALCFALMLWMKVPIVLEHGMQADAMAPWCLLILTYGLFIPNTAKRAAAVVGSLAAIPLVLVFTLYWSAEGTLAEKVNADYVTNWVLMLTVTSTSAVGGTYMINHLREEAFHARQLGQYHLKHLLGAGGMGEVYLAEHQLLKRPCAIKLIHPSQAADPQALARFEREVRATAKLSHWNSIEIFDYGRTEEGTFYYVMEYLPGMSLTDLVERFGPLPPERAVYLLRQTCDALAEAHAVGLIHRDIKPGNIFAASRGGLYDVAKLLDFGLVREISAQDDQHLSAETTITGSPLFMSPEQAMGGGRKPDARSDIYALGAVAYYLVTGRVPFERDSIIKVIVAHAHEEVLPPSHHNPDVPADLEAIIMRCMAKNPNDRFPCVVSLEKALSQVECAPQWNKLKAAQWWESLDEIDEALAGPAGRNTTAAMTADCADDAEETPALSAGTIAAER